MRQLSYRNRLQKRLKPLLVGTISTPQLRRFFFEAHPSISPRKVALTYERLRLNTLALQRGFFPKLVTFNLVCYLHFIANLSKQKAYEIAGRTLIDANIVEWQIRTDSRHPTADGVALFQHPVAYGRVLFRRFCREFAPHFSL